jgi:hypothetical protein
MAAASRSDNDSNRTNLSDSIPPLLCAVYLRFLFRCFPNPLLLKGTVHVVLHLIARLGRVRREERDRN